MILFLFLYVDIFFLNTIKKTTKKVNENNQTQVVHSLSQETPKISS